MAALGFDEKRVQFVLETLCPERLTRVVDIGANPLSPPPYDNLFKVGGCEVWGFEPQQTAYERLISERQPNQHYLPYAIGTGEPATLHICKGSGFTSLLEPNTAGLESLGVFTAAAAVLRRVEVETRRLDDLDDLPDFDLLKIDIQGGEQAVFKNGSEKLANAVGVISEVAAIPLYIDQPLLDDQMRTLRSLGFDLHKFLFFKKIMRHASASANLPQRYLKSQLIDGDAIFVRNILDLSALTTQQLRHLAIISDAVFESYDLTIQIFGLLAASGIISAASVNAYQEHLLRVINQP